MVTAVVVSSCNGLHALQRSLVSSAGRLADDAEAASSIARREVERRASEEVQPECQASPAGYSHENGASTRPVEWSINKPTGRRNETDDEATGVDLGSAT